MSNFQTENPVTPSEGLLGESPMVSPVDSASRPRGASNHALVSRLGRCRLQVQALPVLAGSSSAWVMCLLQDPNP